MSVKTIALLILSFDVIAIGRGPLRPVVSPDIASVRRVSHTADEGTDAGEAAGQQIEYKGTYVNKKYGFSVTIPDHLVGKGTIPPAPNHGFEISLSSDPNDSIGVFAYYDVADEPSPPTRVSSASALGGTIRKAVLGGLPAKLRTHITPASSELAIPIVEEVMWAHRQSGGERIEYTLILTTRNSLLPTRERIFREMVASFKLLPVR